jgi:hypothetical protein
MHDPSISKHRGLLFIPDERITPVRRKWKTWRRFICRLRLKPSCLQLDGQPYRPTLYLQIENPPYLVLVIEATPEPGPCGLRAISVAHYGEQNGDLMRDLEMCF